MTVTTHGTATMDAVLDQLAAQVETPVHAGVPQAQGDLLVIPVLHREVPPAKSALPQAGSPLVRGQGGHVHLLLGRACWDKAPGQEPQTIGTLTVPAGEVAYLAHGDGSVTSALSRDADHALVAIGEGTYVIRRQREQADEIALVAD